ncbi:hypothetical protein [Okeania hirsuta]|uniref:hypothetical protein n=1 Tax=Okeania hirsuta TaxID=1458930 RepID=UPI001375163D|nr:hypothetical protein [Okeania hirsuta]NET78123.1 hypothetical protein [Okeania sp. SIO1F9]
MPYKNYCDSNPFLRFVKFLFRNVKIITIPIEEGDRRQETGDRRKITWGFSPQVILNTV